MIEFATYADRDMLAISLASRIAGDLTSALLVGARATLIVPGGSTPGPVFDVLCAADLDWSRVDVLLSDERWVPEDDPASNAALVRSRLLVNRASAAVFLPFHVPGRRPEEVLADIEAMIAPHLPATVALLGMGADMHTASLFPGAPGLAEALDANAPLLVALRLASQDHARVSLSARVLRHAMALHLIITGADKRAALAQAENLPATEAPVAAILDQAVVHWAE